MAVLGSFDRLPDDPARHRYWIIDRARNACKAVLRSQRRQDRLRQRLSAQPHVSDHDVADRLATRDELERLLMTAGIRTELDRDVIVLVMSGYRAAEIGALLGLSTSAVETRLSRARRRLTAGGVSVGEDFT